MARAALSALLLVCLASIGFAQSAPDALILKTGERIEGKIQSESAEEVEFEAFGTSLWFSRSDIETIERAGAASPASEVPASAEAAAPAAGPEAAANAPVSTRAYLAAKAGPKLLATINKETDDLLGLRDPFGTFEADRAALGDVLRGDAVPAEAKDPTAEESFAFRQAVCANTAKAHEALAGWAQARRLADQAAAEWKKVLELDPENAKAHRALGHKRFKEQWLTPDEYAAAAKNQPKKVFPPRDAGRFNETFQSGGADEPYVIQIPTGYRPDQARSLVICLHGAGDTADNFLRCLFPLAGASEMIFAAPQNISQQGGTVPMDLVAHLQDGLNVDKVYFFGFSAGGWSTSRHVVANTANHPTVAAACIAGAGLSAGCPKATPQSPSVAILIGKSDPNYSPSVQAKAALEKNGWTNLYREFDGGHTLPNNGLIKEIFEWFRKQ